MESGPAVQRAVDALPSGRWLLAVSGGRDSMVLLHAMAAARAREIAAVATFDHGTGPQATDACDLVARESAARGLTLRRGRAARGVARTEAAWREARWAFLYREAAGLGASVVTAHIWDDQVETVVLRLVRGAGPRGLAGMLAADPHGASGPIRPLLRVPRQAVAAYAAQHQVPSLEDPSNQTSAFQRNRVRLEILPALERVARLVLLSREGPTAGAEPEGWSVVLPPLRTSTPAEEASQGLEPEREITAVRWRSWVHAIRERDTRVGQMMALALFVPAAAGELRLAYAPHMQKMMKPQDRATIEQHCIDRCPLNMLLDVGKT